MVAFDAILRTFRFILILQIFNILDKYDGEETGAVQVVCHRLSILYTHTTSHEKEEVKWSRGGES